MRHLLIKKNKPLITNILHFLKTCFRELFTIGSLQNLTLMFQDKKALILGGAPIGIYQARSLARERLDVLHLADQHPINTNTLQESTLALTDFGTSKLVLLKEELKRLSPDTDIELLPGLLNSANNFEALRVHLSFRQPSYDLIVDCTRDVTVRQVLEGIGVLVLGWYGTKNNLTY